MDDCSVAGGFVYVVLVNGATHEGSINKDFWYCICGGIMKPCLQVVGSYAMQDQ